MTQRFTECDHGWNWRQFGNCPACENDNQQNRAVPISAETLEKTRIAIESLMIALGNWIEIADDEDKRDSDAQAMQQGRAVLDLLPGVTS